MTFLHALRLRALKQIGIGFGSAPDPCVSVSGPTPAMDSPRILRVGHMMCFNESPPPVRVPCLEAVQLDCHRPNGISHPRLWEKGNSRGEGWIYRIVGLDRLSQIPASK